MFVPTDERISTLWLSGAKPLTTDADAVGVEWHVGEDELALCVGGLSSVKPTDVVDQMDHSVGNHCSRRIGKCAAYGSGVAALGRRV